MAVGAVAGLTACGSSTAPITPSFKLAAHFDTLAVQASSVGQFDRYRLLSYAIAALAENATPTAVTVTVDGANQNYSGVALDLVSQTAGSAPVPSDSVFVLVAWSDSDAHELIYTQIVLPDTLADVADLSDSVANVNLDSATVLSATLVSAKNHCKQYTLPLTNAAVSSFQKGSSCASGTISGAFTFFFTPSATNPHATFVLAPTSLAGIRLLLTPNTGGQERIRHEPQTLVLRQ
jgi:hypothetical protein